MSEQKYSDSPEIFSNESGYLGFLLRKSSHIFRIKMEKALDPYGITPPQFTILKIISIFPGFTNAEISRFAALTPQTVNLMVNKLEQSQMVIKKSHPENKKIQLIEITSEGEILLKTCGEKIHALEQTLVQDFSEQELSTIRKWFTVILSDEFKT